MSNNAAGLNAKLDTALSDASDKTWSSAEKDDLIAWAVERLYPRHLYTFGPQDYTQAVTAGTYFYDLDPAIMSLTGIELEDSDGNEFGPLEPGTWRIDGDYEGGTAQVHIAPTIVDNIGGVIRYAQAYGRFDVTSQLIPDVLVELVLSWASEQALQRVLWDRARYKAWSAQSQQSNVSVNEMLQLINDAKDTSVRLNAERRTWRKPMPARV